MRVLITGIDGYLGWSLAVYLTAKGYEVGGIDNGARRGWVDEAGSHSVVPIRPMTPNRVRALDEKFGTLIHFFPGSLRDYDFVENTYRSFGPDAIVYLGEQPSAAYSMKNVEHATFTQANNVLGTLVTLHAMCAACPEAHLLKLGSMGEFGTPKDCPIPEGKFPDKSLWFKETAKGYDKIGSLAGMMFPRQAGSFYHVSKVHDTHNIEMACRLWGLRSTDVMQGVVYGTRIDEMGSDPRLLTRFDVDECFGTVLNRFVAQAIIGHPLTVYGKGGQTRGYLPLRDSMRCLEIALQNPPEPGEYRTFNQFADTYTVSELATAVQTVGGLMGFKAKIHKIPNPRIEQEKHRYQPDHSRLAELGYKPTGSLGENIGEMFEVLRGCRGRIEAVKLALLPTIQWGRPA